MHRSGTPVKSQACCRLHADFPGARWCLLPFDFPAPRSAAGQHRALEYRKGGRPAKAADIALDPFPCPGGTTGAEGLWMGGPCSPWRGNVSSAIRVRRFCTTLDYHWIAADEDDTVAKTAAFARVTQAVAALRAGLHECLRASPVCDVPRFARNFDDAMRGMWQTWCGEQQPLNAAHSLRP
jgi:predicted O-linked N-acetylglucosamine transferase (SPINDLY family)